MIIEKQKKINTWQVNDDHILVNWFYDDSEETFSEQIVTDDLFETDTSSGGIWVYMEKEHYNTYEFTGMDDDLEFISIEDLVTEKMLSDFINA